MKITLEFESYEEAQDYLKVDDYITALNNFKKWLRNEWKYIEHEGKEHELIDKIYEKFNERVNDNNIDL